MEGKGVMVWPDGRKYDGQFVKNIKQGYGELHYADGSIYKGQWMNGL